MKVHPSKEKHLSKSHALASSFSTELGTGPTKCLRRVSGAACAVLFLLVLTILPGSTVLAQEDDAGLMMEEPYLLEDVVVIEERMSEAEELEESPHSVSVIRSEDFEGEFTTVDELLSRQVGVRVNQSGGVGSFSSISIRGSTSEQVVVLLDGIPLNSALGGGVNLGNLPVSNVESIEVYRGSSPNRFGLSGIGGVVNIKTKKVRGEKDFFFQSHYGSYETFGTSAYFGHKPGNLDYSLGVEYIQSENDFEFLDTRGTDYNEEDDRWETRRNNDYQGLDATARLGYDLGPFRLDFLDNYHVSDKGLAGTANAQAEDARFSRERNLAQLQAAYETDWGMVLDAQLYHAYKLDELDDRKGEVGGGSQDTNDVTTNLGGRLRVEFPWGRHQIPSLLGRFAYEKFSPEDLLGPSVPDSDRTTTTLGVQDQILFFDDRLAVVPSLKYDHVENDFAGETLVGKFETGVNQNRFDKLTRQVGVKFSPIPDLSFKGNVGLYYRFPSFFELFGNNGTILGNPDLGPEEGLNRDFGLAMKWAFDQVPLNVFLEAIYFDNEVEDLIAFEQATGQVARPRNVDDASIEGWEFTIRADALEHLSIDTNITYQQAVNEGPVKGKRGNRIPQSPLLETDVETTLYFEKWDLMYEFRHMAGIYLDLANLAPARDRYLHNIGFTYRPVPDLSLTFQVNNLTDEHYQDFYNQPLPGRAYYFTLRLDDWSFLSKLFR